MKLGPKILVAVIAPAVLTVAVVSVVLMRTQHTLGEQIASSIRDQAVGESRRLAHAALQLVASSDARNARELDHGMALMREEIDTRGGFRQGRERLRWTAVNQVSGQSHEVTLPALEIGGEPLGRVQSPADAVPLVDPLSHTTGLFCTVFQRMNREGDMLRVATTVLKDDGQRAIGTFIPARDTAGAMNRVVETVLNGDVFVGRAYVVNDWHATVYAPLRAEGSNEIIGMIYLGLGLREINEELREAIMGLEVGESGYVYVIGGRGDQRGRYIVSQGGKRDGENIWDARDAEGRYFIREAVERATALEPGDIDVMSYQWQNPGETEAQPKIVALTYYAPWDWIIGAGMYESDFAAAQMHLDRAQGNAFWAVIVAAIIILAASAAGGVWLTRRITGPVRALFAGLGRIAEGDLSARVEEKGNDEIAALSARANTMARALDTKASLARAIGGGNLRQEVTLASSKDALGIALREMIERLREVIGTVRAGSTEVSQGSQDLARAAETVSASASSQAAATEQISAAMEESSASARQTAENARKTGSIASEVADRAAEAEASVREAVAAMEDITKRTAIVEEIAAQTDLLALNAAVEAARAGEAGKGFAVVADRVRQLSDRCQQAAGEIREVSERSRTVAGRAGSSLEGLAREMAETASLVKSIVTSTEELKAGSGQVNSAVQDLDKTIQKNTAAAEEMAAAASELSSHAERLAEAIRFFREQDEEMAAPARASRPQRQTSLVGHR